MVGENNPFNLEANSIDWEGELPATGRFANFASLFFGTRAGLRVIVEKQRLHGCETIQQIVDDFARNAPADHNDLAAYGAFMAGRLGQELGEQLTPDSPVDVTDPAVLTAWGAAQAWFEAKIDLLAQLGAEQLLAAAKAAIGL